MNIVLQSLFHPDEISALLALKFGQKSLVKRTSIPLNQLSDRPSREFCYFALTKVSRSFAVVIQRLSVELRDAVCVFYLVLRGLDTVEDDMAISNELKVPLLKSFYEKLELDDWNIDGIGYKDEKILLQTFGHVISMYKSLKQSNREVISQICREMGEGMAKFAGSSIISIDSTSKYDEYCHYVAGLVGIGLTKLFLLSELEDPKKLSGAFVETVANSMGLFLQKTNIIRDYLEDMDDGRTWWPKDIWERHAPSLEWFKNEPKSEKSLNCLNEMICDALSHLPHCLDYIGRITDHSVFEFCAVPQVMAIGTLAELYDNPNVFKRIVKLRKGLSAKLMIQTKDISSFHSIILEYSSKVINKMKIDTKSQSRYVKRTQTMLEGIVSKSNLLVKSTGTQLWFNKSSLLIYAPLILLFIFFTMFMQIFINVG